MKECIEFKLTNNEGESVMSSVVYLKTLTCRLVSRKLEPGMRSETLVLI